MKRTRRKEVKRFCAPHHVAVLLSAAVWPAVAVAQTSQTIRIVTYNTQDDVGTGGDSGPTPTGVLPYLGTVIEGIGQQKYVGDDVLQLPDIIALQETTSNSATVAPLLTELNSYYGSNIFSSSTYQATTSDGNTFGGGPNALIYNQNTINLLASVGVGTPESTSNGEFRQAVRYEFQPVADKGTTAGIFYVYDDHYKSGSATTTDGGVTIGTLRNEEAQIIRNDEAANLPANAAVLYVGDYNLDGSSEAMYQTITASNAPSGATQGQGIDPLNPTNNYTLNWATNSTYKAIMTESDSDLRYRDDLQTMTSNVYNGATGYLNYITNSYHAFGNNGTTNEGQSINNYPTNTALNDIKANGTLTPSQVFSAMNASLGSDHLPVVADYNLLIGATWTSAGSGSWSTANDWAVSSIAQQAAEIANFVNSTTAPSTITLDSAWTVGTINFNSTNGYTVAPGTGGTLTLDNAGAGSAAITDFGGTHSITAPIALNSSLVVTVNNAVDAMQITGNISGTGGVTTSGSGAVTLSGVNVYTGPTTVNSGLLVVGSSTGLPSATSLTIGTGSSTGAVQLAAGTGQSTVASLAINPGSTLDIMNNSLAINIGSPANDPIATVVGYLTNGYTAATTWTGTSATGGVITSSTAIGSHTVTLGYLDGNVDTGLPAVQANQIVVKYVLVGDSDLSGEVDFTDLAAVLKYFNQSGTDWAQGNFEYAANDPSVASTNFNDLADVLKNFLQTTPGGTSGSIGGTILPLTTTVAIVPTTPVPEPASLGVVSCGIAVLLRRRRRRLLPIGH